MDIITPTPVRRSENYDLQDWKLGQHILPKTLQSNTYIQSEPYRVEPKEQHHDTCDRLVNFFFKDVLSTEQEVCQQITLGHFGFALEHDDRIVMLKLYEDKLACHMLDIEDKVEHCQPMTLSMKYDAEVDGLIICFVTHRQAKSRKAILANDHYYGTNLLFRCDDNHRLISISVLNASEHLSIPQH